MTIMMIYNDYVFRLTRPIKWISIVSIYNLKNVDNKRYRFISRRLFNDIITIQMDNGLDIDGDVLHCPIQSSSLHRVDKLLEKIIRYEYFKERILSWFNKNKIN